ncbi:SubName: Full=Uncharacterized protein {ECO:0000313/EMBL:CCA69848.1} [Serendipita indica DSM 11827]|uniref:Mog1p/PsbP-like protein n=1 Tax=Serendipita indica (strain DSM 11827) TaxID=1109443 RepID=G4TET2_SERID|nr:SubName: Full=Uncharacterized protein {ECO:0000313/EMBL:CCA69848.1} [Serendipita indica DSM 11827]CCA69848.1 hypothetical protein PIIN_03788 [Serendipita indica DSM 11827]
MSSPLEKKDLYGGAITVKLPLNLLDASDLRQVPDAQEVFLEHDSDVSYIFEILDRVEPEDPNDAARFHFESLAQDNSAESSNVIEVIVPDGFSEAPISNPPPILLQGTQQVAKYNKTDLDTVEILMALYRVVEKPHDIIFVVNLPKTATTSEERRQQVQGSFTEMAKSLSIVDFGLFG